MKKNWIRLLAVLLAAVMIFPAAAFADGEDGSATVEKYVSLWCGTEKDNTYKLTDDIDLKDVTSWSKSGDGDIDLDETTGVVTATKAGSVQLTAIKSVKDDESGTFVTSIIGVWYFTITKRTASSIYVKTEPTTKDYVSGQTFDPSGMEIKAVYNNKEEATVPLSDCIITPNPLTAGLVAVTIKWGELSTTQTVTVSENAITDVTIYSSPSELKVGDLLKDQKIQVQVTWKNGTTAILDSGWEPVPSRALTKDDKSFYVTFQGVASKSRSITVTDNSSGGSGGGSGETTGDYTAYVYKEPTKKDYNVGDKFDWTGATILIYKPGTGNTLYATLYGADLARYEALEYTFKTSDILGSGKTSIKCNFSVDGHKVKEFSITGLTVTEGKKTLTLKVQNRQISGLFVSMKRTAYPVGSSIALSDIEYIGGQDYYGNTIFLYPSNLSEYSNSFSIEVLRSDKTTKTYNKDKIESTDVYTDRTTGDKFVYLRLNVDSNYLDFQVESGDSGVYVYYGSTLLGIYSELAKALEDVNDLDFQWGSSQTKYSDTRKLTVKLGEDMKLGRYDGQIALNRDIDIDLNGHKLTVYSDIFVFLDKKLDVYKATIGNTATETGKLIYENMPYDDLLIDKGESIVFQYTDDKDADLPGIYTLTVEEPKNGKVASNPAMSNKNTVTVSHGHDATFTVTPDANYEIEAVKVKSGTSATATTVSTTTNTGYSVNSSGVATYTMKDIKGAATITATFKATKEEKPADTWVNPFKDISSYASYFDAVKYVSQNGLMQGDDLGNFNPSETMTRAQFVTTLGRMYLSSIYSTVAEKDAAMIRTYGTDSQFTDVSYSDGRISYAVPYIKWAESNGLVQGYGNGKFGPYDTITHQQMYIIMYRYAQSLAMKSINVSNVTLRATDADQLGAGWLAAAKEGAIAAAKYAQQQNFLVSTTRIDPNGNALRYELATLLMQFSKNVLGRQ
jgi:hypothetical protein